MSTTLTNGLKLPDKGSVDWYADMQNNYTILDGAVGTIADHTTAIAGKAASSHTHTKSDVTDLLNSNFIPSANNAYDLGSSSNQWNKIYSADVVHTSGDETITGVKTLVDYWRLQAKNLKAGEGEPYGRTGYSVIYTDKNATPMGDVTLFKNANAARTFIRIRGGDYYTNGTPAAAGTLVQSALMVGTNVSGKKIIECDTDIVYPTTNSATDLGDSTHKWKTFNGVNPGALSLPDLSVSQNVDTTGWVYNGTTLNSVLLNSGDTNVTKNGWLYIRTNSTVAGDRIGVRLSNTAAEYPTTIAGEIGFGHVEVFVPLVAGYKAYVFTNKAPTYIRFYPCLGNVPSGV